MKNLLIITQKVDENDDLLGFFAGWIREFSKNFDNVFVITLAKGAYELPDNVFVYSLGKEAGSSKFIRFIKFYWYLLKLVPKSKGVFVHMSPIFAISSWPAAFLFRKRIFFWYLHRSVTLRLKIAEKLSYKILTAAKESLNVKSIKIIELGHGIDVENFKTERRLIGKPDFLKILSVGRISKIKDYETLIKAAAILRDRGLAFKIKIIGRPVMPYDFEYFEGLKKLVADLGLKDFIEFVGFIPYSNISHYYKEADIFINLAPTGGIDKAVLEAMASASLVLVSNAAFKKYFGDFGDFLIFKHGDQNDLSQKIQELVDLPEENLRDIVGFLQESISKNHSLKETIYKISEIIK